MEQLNALICHHISWRHVARATCQKTCFLLPRCPGFSVCFFGNIGQAWGCECGVLLKTIGGTSAIKLLLPGAATVWGSWGLSIGKMSRETLQSRVDSCNSLQAGTQAMSVMAGIPQLQGLDVQALMKTLQNRFMYRSYNVLPGGCFLDLSKLKYFCIFSEI